MKMKTEFLRCRSLGGGATKVSDWGDWWLEQCPLHGLLDFGLCSVYHFWWHQAALDAKKGTRFGWWKWMFLSILECEVTLWVRQTVGRHGWIWGMSHAWEPYFSWWSCDELSWWQLSSSALSCGPLLNGMQAVQVRDSLHVCGMPDGPHWRAAGNIHCSLARTSGVFLLSTKGCLFFEGSDLLRCESFPPKDFSCWRLGNQAKLISVWALRCRLLPQMARPTSRHWHGQARHQNWEICRWRKYFQNAQLPPMDQASFLHFLHFAGLQVPLPLPSRTTGRLLGMRLKWLFPRILPSGFEAEGQQSGP